jgi:hypothetical protein
MSQEDISQESACAAAPAKKVVGLRIATQNAVGGGLNASSGFEFCNPTSVPGFFEKIIEVLKDAVANPARYPLLNLPAAAVEAVFGPEVLPLAAALDGLPLGIARAHPAMKALCATDRYTPAFPHLGKPVLPNLHATAEEYLAAVKVSLNVPALASSFEKVIGKNGAKMVEACAKAGIAVPITKETCICAQAIESYITSALLSASAHTPKVLMGVHAELRKAYEEAAADPLAITLAHLATTKPDIFVMTEQSDADAEIMVKETGLTCVSSPITSGPTNANLFVSHLVTVAPLEDIKATTKSLYAYFDQCRGDSKIADLTDGANYAVPVMYNGAKFIIVPAHFKSNGSQTRFMLELLYDWNQQVDGTVILVGDINNTMKTTPVVRAYMGKLIAEGKASWCGYCATTNKMRAVTPQVSKVGLADSASKDEIAVFGEGLAVVGPARFVSGAALEPGRIPPLMPSPANPFDHVFVAATVVTK